MHKKFRAAFCLLILFFPGISFFSYTEETEKKIELSLQECISLSLESNPNIRIQRINQQIQDSIITAAKGSFDPSFTFGPNISSVEEPSPTPGLAGAEVRSSESQGFSLSIIDPIFTGGSYGLSFNSNRSESNSEFRTFNPAYSSGFSFNVTQPLLRGFGISVNRTPITIAQNNKAVSHSRLKSQIIQTLSQVQYSYWELVFAIENLKAQQLSLKQAKDLLKKNRRLKELGKATTSDILQAQSAVASREADIIAAKDSVKDAEDRLKRITNIIQDETKWGVSIIPVDIPSFEEFSVDLEESIASALENRPEYIQIKKELENSDIYIKAAKNRRLPNLDLEGSWNLNGLGDELDEPLSQVGKADYDTWHVGLYFRMPIGGRVASSELKRSQYEKEQTLLAMEELEQQITGEVRGAVRQIGSNKERIEATKAAEEFAKQALVVEERKYELGLSNSFELLQFQANLANATRNRLRAVIDYRKSIVVLYQTLGTTLENLNIELE